jgi:PAS domain S-box-containing protein
MSPQVLDAIIIETVASLVIVLDREGHIVRFNRACERATGYLRHEVLNRPFWRLLLAPEETAGVREAFNRLLAGEMLLEHENDWMTKDGARLRIAWSNTVSLDDAGQVQFVISAGREITEQRRLERELCDREAWYRGIVEGAAEGICTIDYDGRLTYVNPSFARMLGLPADRVTGRSAFDFMVEGRPEFDQRLERRRHGVRETFQATLRRADASQLPVLIKSNPLLDETGRMIASLAIISELNE